MNKRRTAHPKARYVDIEDKVQRRMMEVEAHLREGAARERPTCQVLLHVRGQTRGRSRAREENV